MKKIFKIIIIFVICFFSVPASAKVGDKIGTALHTDIVAYINHYAIASYAVGGQSCIIAEDLSNFGFDVTWDMTNRSLSITRNNSTRVNERILFKNSISGSFYADILETDISVFANGNKIPSYAIGGYTMVPLEELTCFGEVYWVQEERALKLWVDGLSIRNTAQEVLSLNISEYSFKVYITPTGIRYHYSLSCAGKNGWAVDIEKAKKRGYTPCKKCT